MRILLYALALGAALVSEAELARAQARPDYEAAKQHFLAGKDLFVRHRYPEAADEFHSAYEITKDPVLLYNVGEAYEKAGRLDEAVRCYEGYLAGVPAAQDREDVERKITTLKQQSSSGWRTPPPAPTPAPPASPPATTPGIMPPPPGASETPKPPEGADTGGGGSSTLRTAGWIGVGLTAALLTAGGMFSLSAQSKEDDIARRQHFVDPATGRPLDYNIGTNAADFQALYDDGRMFRDASIVLFSVAGAAAAATVTLFVVDYYRSGSGSAAIRSSGVRLGAIAAPGLARVDLGWTF